MRRVRLNGRQERVRLKPARVRLDTPARVRLEVLYEGALVYDIGIPSRLGRIVGLGPEVSEVKWIDVSRSYQWIHQYVTNEYLSLAREVGGPFKKARVKLERVRRDSRGS